MKSFAEYIKESVIPFNRHVIPEKNFHKVESPHSGAHIHSTVIDNHPVHMLYEPHSNFPGDYQVNMSHPSAVTPDDRHTAFHNNSMKTFISDRKPNRVWSDSEDVRMKNFAAVHHPGKYSSFPEKSEWHPKGQAKIDFTDKD